MRIDIRFICDDCSRANKEKEWPDRETDEWFTLSEALEHQRVVPTHVIRAEAEIEIHL